MLNQKNSKKQGDVVLAAAIKLFAVQGMTVSIPLTDSQDYDLVVDIDDKLHRVQVKTCTHKNKYGRYEVTLKVSGGNRSGTGKIKLFDKTKVELLYILVDDGSEYLIPTEYIDAKIGIVLGEKFEKYRRK